MAGDLLAGLSSAKAAFDMARALKDISDTAARNAAIIDLQSTILAAQQDHQKTIDRVNELERKLSKFEAWDSEKKRYELEALYDGAFAYKIKEDMRQGEPSHYICANCYQNGQKAILNGATWHLGEHSLICPRCKLTVVHSWQPTSSPPSSDYDPFSSF